MTREQFESCLVSPPSPAHPEAVFEFRQVPGAPCLRFTHPMAAEWETEAQVIEECWQAYLTVFETEIVD